MESLILQRLRESINQRKANLTAWLKRTTPEVRKIREGPLGEKCVESRINELETAMQKADDNSLGICEVCHEFVDNSRLEMDYTACVCIEHLTGTERTQLENELELSQKVQQALLPHRVPVIDGIELAAFSQPAHIVGGDYFDFFRFRDGAHGLVIADVMGKGMPASMLMASLQASLRIIAPESLTPDQAMTRLNNVFCNNIRLTNFVTLFLARYSERDRMLAYCNAGHNPPVLSRQNGTIQYLQPTGAAIGLVEQTSFETASISLEQGDRLLLYTDGVVESTDNAGEFFGEEGLEIFLKKSSHLGTNQVITSLRDQLHEYTGKSTPADDTTMIVLRVTK